MPAPRFFCPAPLPSHTEIALPEAVAHHAVRVLRLRDGADIVLFDGQGGEVPATLVLGKDAPARARLGERSPREAELAGRIVLVQGLPAGDKMDWIVEKSVELGAAAIVPVAARRSVSQLAGPRREKRLARWRSIVQAACEQCGRNRLPSVGDVVTLEQWLENNARSPSPLPVFLCHPEASEPLAPALRALRPDALALLVGPEGGWSDEELAAAARYGACPLRHGSRILRTETAGLALIAAVTAILGWEDGGR
jgi:RNA methyltransferase, RsmE family